MKMSKGSKIRPARAVDETKALSPLTKRIFGGAEGQITFKKGWDAPLTKRELDKFIGR